MEWVAAVKLMLMTSVVEQKRRSERMPARATFLEFARIYASAADAETGRNVAVAHETVAKRIKYGRATVKKIVRFLTDLGLIVEVVRGQNKFSLEELAEISALGGEGQTSMASLRALTIPRAVSSSPLLNSREVQTSSPVSNNSPTRPRARRAAAPRPQAMTRKRISPSRRRRATATCSRPLALQQFAAQLVDLSPTPLPSHATNARLPKPAERGLFWLLRSANHSPIHIGALCDVLSAARIDPSAWTPRDLTDALDQWLAEHNCMPLGFTARNPLRYFAWLLSRAIDPNTLTPRQRAAAEAEQRATERAERARIAAENQRRRETTDYDEIARIIATMKADSAAQARARRHRP